MSRFYKLQYHQHHIVKLMEEYLEGSVDTKVRLVIKYCHVFVCVNKDRRGKCSCQK